MAAALSRQRSATSLGADLPALASMELRDGGSLNGNGYAQTLDEERHRSQSVAMSKAGAVAAADAPVPGRKTSVPKVRAMKASLKLLGVKLKMNKEDQARTLIDFQAFHCPYPVGPRCSAPFYTFVCRTASPLSFFPC